MNKTALTATQQKVKILDVMEENAEHVWKNTTENAQMKPQLRITILLNFWMVPQKT